MNRQTFYDGLTVEEGTMSLIQDNIESADKNLAKDFVGSGIIEGGIVSKVNNHVLRVTDTVGYDQAGNRIEFPEGDIDVSAYVPIDAGKRYISLCLNFSRKNSNPATDDYGQARYYVNAESAKTTIVSGSIVSESPALPVLTADDLLCVDALVGVNGIESLSTSRIKRLSQNDKKLIDVYSSIETAESAAKSYADTKDQALKSEILGGAEPAFDTLLELKEALDDEADAVSALVARIAALETTLSNQDLRYYPIGKIEVQYPFQKSPVELNLPGTWTDVSNTQLTDDSGNLLYYTSAGAITTASSGNAALTYEGLFFRVKGGNAGEFEVTRQGDAIRNITATLGFEVPAGTANKATGALAYTGSNGRDASSGGNSGYFLSFNFDASRVVPTAVENRPVNMSAIIWKKTAA